MHGEYRTCETSRRVTCHIHPSCISSVPTAASRTSFKETQPQASPPCVHSNLIVSGRERGEPRQRSEPTKGGTSYVARSRLSRTVFRVCNACQTPTPHRLERPTVDSCRRNALIADGERSGRHVGTVSPCRRGGTSHSHGLRHRADPAARLVLRGALARLPPLSTVTRCASGLCRRG